MVTADSIKISLIPAGSSFPTESSLSTWISRCKLLFLKRIPDGFSGSPLNPMNLPSSISPTLD